MPKVVCPKCGMTDCLFVEEVIGYNVHAIYPSRELVEVVMGRGETETTEIKCSNCGESFDNYDIEWL